MQPRVGQLGVISDLANAAGLTAMSAIFLRPAQTSLHMRPSTTSSFDTMTQSLFDEDQRFAAAAT